MFDSVIAFLARANLLHESSYINERSPRHNLTANFIPTFARMNTNNNCIPRKIPIDCRIVFMTSLITLLLLPAHHPQPVSYLPLPVVLLHASFSAIPGISSYFPDCDKIPLFFLPMLSYTFQFLLLFLHLSCNANSYRVIINQQFYRPAGKIASGRTLALCSSTEPFLFLRHNDDGHTKGSDKRGCSQPCLDDFSRR